jgi:pimeloyl-ACP methyl ester carboxylesterase
MRGHGRSGKPETEDGYLSARYAEDFMAVAEAFGVTEPVIVGW